MIEGPGVAREVVRPAEEKTKVGERVVFLAGPNGTVTVAEKEINEIDGLGRWLSPAPFWQEACTRC